jgi:hypothetical protein
MRRRLLNLLTALSLLLCVAAVALWVRGHWVGDGIVVSSGRYHHSLDSSLGFLDYECCWERPRPVRKTLPMTPGRGFRRTRWEPAEWETRLPPEAGRFLGFAWGSGEKVYQSRDPFVWVRVPYWSVVAALAAVPAWRFSARARRAARIRNSVCPGCGYDLRATPGQCPECGAGAGADSDGAQQC